MTNVEFHPWVGSNYLAGSKRVLILGESSFGSEARPTYTIECVTEVIGGAKYRFWTNIAMAFLNKRPSLLEKNVFWNDVAFHNYVQVSVGSKARIRPTNAMWTNQKNSLAFFGILDELKPHCVISLGLQLWRWLPTERSSPGPTIANAPQTQTRFYSLEGGQKTLVYGIRHPSAGFSVRSWYPFVKKAMELAPAEPHLCAPLLGV